MPALVEQWLSRLGGLRPSWFEANAPQQSATPAPASKPSPAQGNINLYNRPRVSTPEGTASVRSMSFNEDGLEIVVPTVSDDGQLLTPDQAIARYHRTGKHLGKFATVDEAKRYAESLHYGMEAGRYDVPHPEMNTAWANGAPVSPASRPFDEATFQQWYRERAAQLGLDPDPDNPAHFYDYRAAYRAGAEPDASGHWPSEFKRAGHPRLVVDGRDTRTGQTMAETSPASMSALPAWAVPATMLPQEGPEERLKVTPAMRAATPRERVGDWLTTLAEAVSRQPVVQAGAKALGQGAEVFNEAWYGNLRPETGASVAGMPDVPGAAPVLAKGKRLPAAVQRALDALDQAIAQHPESSLARIMAETRARQGYTVHLPTGRQPTTGLMVGTHSNLDPRVVISKGKLQASHVRKAEERNAAELLRDDRYLGTWQDDPEGFVEVSKRFEPGQIREATKFGELQKRAKPDVPAQKALWSYEHQKTLPIGNVNEFVTGPEFQARLDAMYQAGRKVMGDKIWWNLRGGPVEEIYGAERLPDVAGALAATSPQNSPIPNARYASELVRRKIKGEPLDQPEWRVPLGSVGLSPGGKMWSVSKRNLAALEQRRLDLLRQDKVNDMARALMGDPDVAVIDRRFAKLAEKPEAGVYVETAPDTVTGSMETGKREMYPVIENAVRDAAKRHGMTLDEFSSVVWEGIGDTIKQTGELYGVKHAAGKIPESAGGFNYLIPRMAAEKAQRLGIPLSEFVARLRAGDAELLGVLAATPALAAAWQAWARAQPPREPRR